MPKEVWQPNGGLSLAGTTSVGVGGRRVRVRVTGPADAVGLPIVMLHGIGRSLDDWTEQHQLLSATGHLVISLDLAGHGWSEPLLARTSLSTLARHVQDTLDVLEVSAPIHLMGNSLGGAVAMQLSVAAPQRVASLVLEDSAGFGREVAVLLRLLAIRPLAPLLLKPGIGRSRLVERSLFGNPALATPARVELDYVLANRPQRQRVTLEMARSLGGLRGVRPKWRADLLREVAAAALPTLVVWGDRDRILPAAHHAAALAALPHARGHLFAGAGHIPHIECAADFAGLVDEFLKAVDK